MNDQTLTDEIQEAIKFYYDCGFYSTATQAKTELSQLRAAAARCAELEARVAELTQARDFNAGIIDGLNAAISIKDATIEEQDVQLESFRDLLIMHNATSASDLGGVIDSLTRKVDAQAAQLEQAIDVISSARDRLAFEDSLKQDDSFINEWWIINCDTWLSANAPAPQEERTV